MRRSANALMSEDEPNSKSPLKNNNNIKRCKMSNEESADVKGIKKEFKDENVDESNLVITNGHDHAKASVLDEEIKFKSEVKVEPGLKIKSEVKVDSDLNFKSDVKEPGLKIKSEVKVESDLKLKSEMKLESETQIDSTNFLRRRKKSSSGKRHSQEGPNLFSKLSDELILQIFQYLPKKCITECAQVCRRWRSVAYDESLWVRLDLSGRAFQTDTLAYMMSRNSRIAKMPAVEICSPIFDEYADMMSNFAWKIEYLDLSMAVIKSDDLAILLSKCSELRKLSLEHCTTNMKVCESVAQNLKLETLNMVMCYELCCEGVTKILKNCKRLKELNLGWTDLDKDSLEAVCTLVNEDITHLDISGCKNNMLDEHALKLIDRCRSLVYLDLSDCTKISDPTLDEIVANLTKLQQLSISRCYKIIPQLYPTLSSLPKLTHLNVFGLLNERQLEMLQKCLGKVSINKTKFSTIARPTVGIRRTSIWGLKTRDNVA